MSDYYTSKNTQIDFPSIIMDHYKKILEISAQEFTGGYYNYISTGNTVNKAYVTDKRKEFCQTVEMLAFALHSHFDKTMRGKYDELIKILDDDDKKSKVKIKSAKKMFLELSKLLYRLDYLKAAEYGEGFDDEDDDEDENDDNEEDEDENDDKKE